MDKKELLIAEDTESNFIYLKILLREHYDITWAKNGQEALDFYQQQKPDIIMLDIKMPVMDGLEALTKFRSFDTETPIIMQTAYAFDQDVDKAMSLGASAYLTKPILKDLLFEILNKYS